CLWSSLNVPLGDFSKALLIAAPRRNMTPHRSLVNSNGWAPLGELADVSASVPSFVPDTDASTSELNRRTVPDEASELTVPSLRTTHPFSTSRLSVAWFTSRNTPACEAAGESVKLSAVVPVLASPDTETLEIEIGRAHV